MLFPLNQANAAEKIFEAPQLSPTKPLADRSRSADRAVVFDDQGIAVRERLGLGDIPSCRRIATNRRSVEGVRADIDPRRRGLALAVLVSRNDLIDRVSAEHRANAVDWEQSHVGMAIGEAGVALKYRLIGAIAAILADVSRGVWPFVR